MKKETLIKECKNNLNLKNIFLFFLLAHSSEGLTKKLITKQTDPSNAPRWADKEKIYKTVSRVQTYFEWDVKEVNLQWYRDQKNFEKLHQLGPNVYAVTRKDNNSIIFGPKINTKNFEKIFSHELVHIIVSQKYKQSIPPWMEEGLANYISNVEVVDYKWLYKQPYPKNVHDLINPKNGTRKEIHYKYMASHALIEMLASKCDLQKLLQLSVNYQMEKNIDTFCHIKDINQDFEKWVNSKKQKAISKN